MQIEDDRHKTVTSPRNVYDWLGDGAYFWGANPIRGLHWAHTQLGRGKVKDPAVIGVVLDLGLCLDLMQQKSLEVIATAYEDLAALMADEVLPLPVNTDTYRRELDNKVINTLYELMATPKFQTVRAAFIEGGSLYEGSETPSKTHIQNAVRDLDCIKGVFRVPDRQLD
jgi:hypothetical protein